MLNQLIMNGLIAGSIYALLAIGYTMVYGVLKFINFAHGEIFMLGGYLTYVFYVICGLNFVPSCLIAIALISLIGVLIEKLAYRPLRKKSRLAPLITAIGVSILLQNVVMLIFGIRVKSIRLSNMGQSIEIFGAFITPIQVTILVAPPILMIITFLFIKKTKLGKAIRASADNLTVAEILGINTDTTISATFAFGSGLAAIAGILISLDQNMTPTMGVFAGLKAFTAAVLGGIGNIYGAVLAGYVIGIVENFVIWKLPSENKDMVAFLILLGILWFRSEGLLRPMKERVI